MNRLTTAIALCAILLVAAGCATRNTPAECMTANGSQQAQRQGANQTAEKWDALTGAAIADSDGDATNSNQRVAVDVQAPNQANGPNLQIGLFGDEKQAAQIMTQTLPGEAAVLRRLEQVEAGAEQIRTRLATDPALTLTEKSELSDRLDRYEVQGDALIARLDAYAAKKFEAARAVVPDLSNLRTIVYQITTHQTAGNETPNITDEQGAAIAKVAEAAVTTSQTGGGE